MARAKNLPEFTVSELSGHIKMAVEGAFPYVRVKGEISGLKRAPSGHLYLNLKDENASLAAICWSGSAARLSFKPTEGLEVIASGSITTYAGQSKYQITIETLEPAGLGALMALLEKRKKKLEAEGLFSSARKKPIPYLPKTIGVITSPTGAVIRDIIHRIEARYPTRILVWPVMVQGNKAASQVAEAIRGFNKLEKNGPIPRPDLLIVARGGGSVEDLWPFNEEEPVRAAAASQIPLISAIGHETDTTLIDYAADLRAPTPSAAAEMSVPVKSDLIMQVENLKQRALNSMFRLITTFENTIKSLSRAIPNPKRLVESKTQRLDNVTIKLELIIQNLISQKQQKLLTLSRLLESYHYKRILERGFAIIRDQKGKIIKSTSMALSAKQINIELADNTINATITTHSPSKKTTSPPTQRSLFDPT